MCVCVCVCVCVSMIIHSSVDGLLSCLHILTIVCNAAMSIYLFKLLGFFFFFGYMLRSGIARSCGSSIFSHMEILFLVFFRNLHIVLCGI